MQNYMTLKIDSITKSFGGKPILQDVFISCEQGEIVGLLGRNGSGKSTLLKIAFGIEKAESSFVKIGNKVMQSQSNRKGKLGYLPQNPFLPRNIKIKNFISLFCSDQDVGILREHHFVKPYLDSKCSELSKGEQCIIEILLIIFSESEFAMLDEPFQSLSPKVVEEIKKLIKGKTSEKGFIISNHSYKDVMDICNRIYLLSETSVKPISNPEELKFHKYLR